MTENSLTYSGINKTFKCYKYINDTIKDELVKLNINYILFGKLDKKDYVNLIFFDGDYIRDQLNYSISIGAPDKNIIINNI